MSIEPMSDGLLRQRRNLISICCLMVFIRFSGVEIGDLSLLGVNIGSSENPSAVYIATWVLFFYFLFRYYQYFVQEGVVNLKRYYYEALEGRVIKHVAILAKNINANATYHPHQLVSLKNDKWKVRVTYSGAENSAGEKENVVEHFVFPNKYVNKHRFFALLHISFNSSSVTDYLLPFIVAAVAQIYGFSGSESSLIDAYKNAFA